MTQTNKLHHPSAVENPGGSVARTLIVGVFSWD